MDDAPLALLLSSNVSRSWGARPDLLLARDEGRLSDEPLRKVLARSRFDTPLPPPESLLLVDFSSMTDDADDLCRPTLLVLPALRDLAL